MNSQKDDINIAYIPETIIVTIVQIFQIFFLMKQAVENVQRTKLSEKKDTSTLFNQCYVFPWRSIIICQTWDDSFV